MFKKFIENIKETVQHKLEDEQSEENVEMPEWEEEVTTYPHIINQMIEYAEGLGDSSIFTSDIPQKKLDNVMFIYNIETNNDVHILYDSTVFGSGKDGFVLTSKFAGFKETFKSPVRLSFKEVCQSNANDSSRITIHNSSYPISSVSNKLLYQLKVLLVEQVESMRHVYNETIDAIISDAQNLYINEQYFESSLFIKEKLSFLLPGDLKECILREILFNNYLGNAQFSDAEELLGWFEENSPEQFVVLKEEYEEAYTIHIESQIEEKLNKFYELVIENDFDQLEYIKDDLNHLVQLLPTSQYKEKVEDAFKYLQHAKNQHQIMEYLQYHNYKEAIPLMKIESDIQYLSEEAIKEQLENIEKSKREYFSQAYNTLTNALQKGDTLTAEDNLNYLLQQDDENDYAKEKVMLLILQEKIEEAKKYLVLLPENEQGNYSKLIEDKMKDKEENALEQLKLRNFDFFLQHPEWISLQDEFGMTAIHYAVVDEDLDTFEKLYELADLDLTNYLGHTVEELMTRTTSFYQFLEVMDDEFRALLKKSESKSFEERAVSFLNNHTMSNSEAQRKLDPYQYEKFIEKKQEMNEKLKSYEYERKEAMREANLYAQVQFDHLLNDYYNKIFHFLSGKQEHQDTLENMEKICADIQNKIDDIIQSKNIALEETEDFKNDYHQFKITIAKRVCGEKDEFETTEMYNKRINDTLEQIESSHMTELQQWKRQYAEQTRKTNERKLSDLLSKLKDLEMKKANELKREQFVSKFLSDVSFREAHFKYEARQIEETLQLGKYDADSGYFDLIHESKNLKVKVPLENAKRFKEMFNEAEVGTDYYIEDDQLNAKVYYIFEGNHYPIIEFDN